MSKSHDYEYTLTATCCATVTETWTIRSQVPLTREEVEEALHDSTNVLIECVNEEVSDEEDRTVTGVEYEGTELV